MAFTASKQVVEIVQTLGIISYAHSHKLDLHVTPDNYAWGL